MTGHPKQGRTRTLGAFGAGLVSLLLLPLLGWFAADALRESKEGRDALAGLTPLVSIPATPTGLLAALDDEGQVVSVVMLALAPEEDGPSVGGTVVVVPAGGDTSLPDGSRGRLGDSFAQGGIDALRSTAEGLLGVTLDTAVAVPADDLAVLLGDLGAIDVTLAAPVLDDGRLGDATELFPAGRTTLDEEDIATVLAASSSAEGEQDRLPNIDAVWRGIAARVGAGLTTSADATASSIPTGDTQSPDSSSGLTTVAPPLDMGAFLGRLFAGPLQIHWLATTRVTSPTENPDGLDLLRLDTGEITVVMATIAPSAVSPPNPTLSFYVKSSLNDPALTKDAVERLLLAGANVVLVTENPDQTPPAATTIQYADENDADEAGRFGEQLGTFTSALSDVRIDGVDATFVLGETYRAERSSIVHGGATSGTATTTPRSTSTTDASTTESTTG